MINIDKNDKKIHKDCPKASFMGKALTAILTIMSHPQRESTYRHPVFIKSINRDWEIFLVISFMDMAL